MHTTSPPLLSFGCVLLSVGAAQAAVLSAVDVEVVSSVNLTTTGTTDWAAWHRGNNDNIASAAPNYRKSGGAATISAITTTNPGAITGPPSYAGTVRGTNSSGNYPASPFSWSDATGGAAGPTTYLSGIFHTTTAQSVHGVQFSISNLPALASGETYRITVYGTSYGNASTLTLTNGLLSAFLNGEPKETGNGSKTTNAFAFDFNPDSEADVLTVALRLSGSPLNANGHAAIQAVSISVIPEPATPLLAFAGAALIVSRRKRTQGILFR